MKAIIAGRDGRAGPWTQNVKAGLRRHGIKAEISLEIKPCDFFVVWNAKSTLSVEAQATGPTLIHENGYIDRKVYKSFAWDGLNGKGKFYVDDVPDDRWQRWKHLLKPWKERKGYDLLIGQVPFDASLDGIDIHEWCNDIAAELDDVYFRRHPMCPKPYAIVNAETLSGPLSDAFDGAGRVITYNSNTAVESVLDGIPTISFDKGSMAWDVTSHSLDAPPYMADRDDWGAKLAYCQWSPEEIRNGDFWETLCRHFS